MRKSFIITLLLMAFTGFSQDHQLGKVTVAELKEKVCPTDTAASAAILFNIGKTRIEFTQNEGFQLVTEIATKIKIYKKEGYEFANHAVAYYSDNGNDSEKVNVSKAATYNLVNDKIEKTKLASEGEFIEKINKYWSKKKIVMPNVKEGSIIEFKIEITSPYSGIPEWEFQKDIPVNYSEFTSFVPEYFTYNTRTKGYYSPTVNREITAQSLILTSKERYGRVNHTVMTKFNTDKIDYKETRTKYILENIPALKDEVYVNNINNYRSSVMHELSGTTFPGVLYENYSSDWSAVARKIYQNENFGGELEKTNYFEKDLAAMLSGISSPEEKAARIFSYVKSSMMWNDVNSVFCDAGVKKAYQEKGGNSAEINLMLISMLRYAGLNANPILVSTRSNGVSYFPSRTSFNHVICGVELQNQTVLLDATDKYSMPNIIPIRDLNWFGRIIRKDETSDQIGLMPESNSKDIFNIMASIDDKGEVSGKVRNYYYDYNALVYRNENNGFSKDECIEKLEKKHKGLEVAEFDVQNSTNLAQPIIENYSFSSNNSVEVIGDKMYLSPFLFLAKSQNPFTQETREFPIDFVYPSQEKFTISLAIPKGYVVETLPVQKAMGMPDNLASFKYNITVSNNQIQLFYTFDTNQAIMSAEYYETLKEFYKEIVNKQTEKIVLKKA